MLLSRKYKPQFLLNFDEINTSKENNSKTYQIKLKNVETSSFHMCNNLSSSTLLFISSADGDFFPVVLIIPLKKIPEEIICFQSANFRIYPSSNGFMTKELMEKIFEDIILKGIRERRALLNWNQEPALIIFDGHTSRNSDFIFQKCCQNNIDLLCLPGHVSHLIQPHDLRVSFIFMHFGVFF
jgi:hypothetical protein